MLTLEQFQKVLPTQVKKSVNAELIDKINNTLSDPVLLENYRDNLLSYTSVMRDGRFKIQSYLDAVRYVSFKLLGSSNIDAYVKTFPDRYQTMLNNNTDGKDIASYVTAYNKNKLVNLIFEQTLIPFHVLNADKYQHALNVQVELMVSAKSEKVRSDAANSVMTHLKPPESKKIELDITMSEDKSLTDLKAATMDLVLAQKKALLGGISSITDIAHSNIINDAEFVEIT
jgi:hypothetical protein